MTHEQCSTLETQNLKLVLKILLRDRFGALSADGILQEIHDVSWKNYDNKEEN